MEKLGKDISLQVNVCSQCGDIGISEALVNCIMCNIAARHRYCFEEIPEDITAELDWFCEDCVNKPTPTSLGILDHGSRRPLIGPKNPCQEKQTSVELEKRTPEDPSPVMHSSDREVIVEKKRTSEDPSPAEHSPGRQVADLVRRISEDSPERELVEHGSGRPVKNPCQEIVSGNDHFVNSPDQHPVSDVRIGSSVNLASTCFKQNDDFREEFSNEHSKKERVLDKDELDDCQPPFEAQDTNIQFGAKGLADIYIEASNEQIIGGTSTFDIGELGEGRSSVCVGQKEDERDESEKERPELNSYQPLINGNGTKFSSAIEGILDTSFEPHDGKILGRSARCTTHESSACYKQEEEEIELYEKRKLKSRKLIMQTYELNTDKAKDGPLVEMCFDAVCDTSSSPKERAISTTELLVHPTGDKKIAASEVSVTVSDVPMVSAVPALPSIEGQGSSFRLAFKRLSGTSIGESGKQTIGSTSRCNNDSLEKVRSSACFELKEGEIKAQVDTRRRRRRSRSRRRTFIPPIKGEREDKAFDKKIMRIKTSKISGEIRSSVCFELEKSEMEIYRNDELESRNLIRPTNDELNNLHVVIDRRDTNMKLVATKLPGNSVMPSENHTRWVDTEDQIKSPWPLQSHSLPLVLHVWRGCFNINKIEIGPLRAHLSSGACLKVCDLARQLPSVLHLQKLPRLVGWPNSFKVSSPTDENIALYFFPESDRVETVINELVDDLINKDLMLRFEFDEVELLVFSSFVLPQEHQRIFGKYYPWGVFKPRSSKICSLPAGSQAGSQTGDLLKPVRRSEVEDHDDGLFKLSAQEIDAYTLELKEVVEEIKDRIDMVNSRQKVRVFRKLEREIWDVADKFIDDS